ncbi:LysE family translocator [Pelagovum pacificum]|uniref:LysE family translocator n=1 Tax=Pelagovum pacificum TaxID=2588711 RepID=A0A5C5GBZ3_9RHOB|nr:LysE family translocator [Pelagovum pacificum]QQA42421.1 LysE family translocator [Pelagovum pacificum]TNY31504.1 LysE family translocator [Pelagovum pacificum]
MIDDLPNLLIAWGIQLTGVLSPGPAVAMLLGISATRGRAPALWTCVGIGMGAMLIAVLTVFGFATILAEWRAAMVAVKIIGAGYLAWLAWGAFRKALSPPPPPSVATTELAGGTLSRIGAGFLFQIGNPKAIFFWIAVAAVGSLQTISAASVALFLAGAFTISFLGHGGWALVLSSAPFRALYTRARRGVEATLGVFFAFASFKILTTRT